MRLNKRILIMAALTIAALLALCTAFAEASDDAALEEQYEAAQALFEAGDYEAAYEAFKALGKYSDSRNLADRSKKKWDDAQYHVALELQKAGSFQEAIAIYESLGDHRNSRKNIKECKTGIQRAEYKRAKELYNAGDYQAAKEAFEALDRFEDSRQYLKLAQEAIAAQEQAALELSYYEKGLELEASGDYEAARDAFIEAGDTKDATDRIHAVSDVYRRRLIYEAAVRDYESGNYQTALGVFTALGDYEESAEKAELCKSGMLAAAYARAGDLADKNPASAYLIYLSLEDYENSAELAEGLRASLDEDRIFTAAEKMNEAQEYEYASIGYKASPSMHKSAARAEKADANAAKMAEYRRAMALRTIGEEEQANAILKSLGSFNSASRQVQPVMQRFTAGQLRNYRTTPMSEEFTAPDGSKHRYRIYKGVHTWVEAKAFCEVLGGHLATLTTDEENQFVYWFMRDNGFLTAYFGLSDEERKGNWIWVTGEPFEYSNWHRGEPSRSAKERYGMYFYKHTKGTWNDSHIYERTEVDPGCSYICEWDE